MSAYGEPNGIHIVGTSRGLDLNMILVSAAIAIPNLLKSRTAANEAGAAATVRTLNTAEFTYQNTYPARGFASNLAMLGPGPDGACDGKDAPSEKHACLIDAELGCNSETGCLKHSYRFTLAATCDSGICTDFVVVAAPVDSGGGKSFCSTSDAVVRFQSGTLGAPVSAEECRAWPPL
jgi:hypothetical protein